MSLSIDRAQLIALVLESLFFGVYLITLVPCFKVLLWRNDIGFLPLHSIRWTMLIVCLSFAISNVTDFSTGFYRVVRAFTMSPQGAIAEFSEISDWTNIVTTVDALFPILLGDLVLIYRCWIVYSKLTMIVVLPILLWIGSASSGIAATGIESSLHAETLITTSQASPFFISFAVLINVQNIVTTSLIVHRIWIIDRDTFSGKKRGCRSPLRRVIRIIIESGMMYTVTLLMCLGFLLADSTGVYITSRLLVPIIGITFDLIIIRTHHTSVQYTLPDSSNARSYCLTSVLPQTAVSESVSEEV